MEISSNNKENNTESSSGNPRNLITINGLRIERGSGDDTFVVDIPQLCIKRGSFTSILGPSGCGKTSLLFVLGLLRVSGEDPAFKIACDDMSFHLVEPLQGTECKTVTLFRDFSEYGDGERLSRDNVETFRQQLIGFCLQGGELIPSLALDENVAVPANLGGFAEARSRASKRLNAFAMEDRLFTSLPGQLSGGQNQRGVLARSLVHDPPIILLDEPTSALDRNTAEAAIQLLQSRARARGQTVIMVTHDEKLAHDFSDCIVRMDSLQEGRGEVVAVEDPGRSASSEPRDDTGEKWSEQSPVKSSLFSRIGYYLRLSFLDAVGPLAYAGRRISLLGKISTYAFAFQLVKNSLIAVAIGLLILLLRGVSAGMVEEFRQSLIRSPTARELTITPMGVTGGLDSVALRELERRFPQIDLTIPQVTHIVSLTNPPTQESSLTLAGTLPNDPKISALYSDQNFETFDSTSLIISSVMAKERNVSIGDEILIWVARALDAEDKTRELHEAKLKVSHILEGGDKKTAYAHLTFMDQIADYKAGRPVPVHNWPGFANAITPRYESFLLFAKRPLSARENRVLETRGLVSMPLEAADPRRRLYGRLKEPSELPLGKPSLHAYEVLSGRQKGDLKWLDASLAAQVKDLLIDSDAVLLLWNEPLSAHIGEQQEIQLVGLSGSIRWLKSYLRHRSGIFPLNEDGWTLAFEDRVENPREMTLSIDQAREVLKLPIDVHGDIFNRPTAKQTNTNEDRSRTGEYSNDPSTPKKDPPQEAAAIKGVSMGEYENIAIVPAAFLSHLRMSEEGLANPDLDLKLFREVSEEALYYQVRIFVSDVFQVADLHERLAENFGVRSNQARVREVQRYSRVLDLLVRLLSLMALGIALATIYVVFHDVTVQKKRMIGTLRILGLSRMGVIVMLLVRGLLVAFVASSLIYILGQIAELTLNIYYGEVICLLARHDYFLVTAGIFLTCFFAVLLPAWKVAQLDPVVALEEAKMTI